MTPIRKDPLPFGAEAVAQIVEKDGAFELLDANKEIILIGGTPNLRHALQEHLNSADPRMRMARYFRYEEAFQYTVRESELLQQFMRMNARLPVCNEDDF